MKKYKITLFDLDGTLVDSGEGIMKCAQYSLAHFGINVEDIQTLRPFVGPPLEDSYKMFYGFSDENATKAVEIYRNKVPHLSSLPQAFEVIDLKFHSFFLCLFVNILF